MEKQEHNNHSTTGHENHGHDAGHHHGFKGIEQWTARLDNPEREKRQLPNEVIVRLGLQSNDVVADIGAGTGYFAIRIAEAFPQVRVIAADSEPEMIDLLKSQATARNIANLEPVLIEPSKPHLPVKANLALMVNTLHHIEHRVEYLKFLRKTMVPGSRIAVVDYSMESLEGPPSDHRIPVVEVVDELRHTGYTLEQNLEFLPNQFFLIFKEE